MPKFSSVPGFSLAMMDGSRFIAGMKKSARRNAVSGPFVALAASGSFAATDRVQRAGPCKGLKAELDQRGPRCPRFVG